MSKSITEKIKDFEIDISEVYDSLHNYYMCVPDVEDGGYIAGAMGKLEAAMSDLEDARHCIIERQ